MEQLPDELWLLVCTYLHSYDVIYSFANLNLRFQAMTQYVSSSIKLNDLSYKLFSRFCQDILPGHGHRIYDFTIKDSHQLNFFREYNELLKHINHLHYLTLIARQWSNELIVSYLKYFPLLTTLQFQLSSTREQRLDNILSNHLSLLTDLILSAANDGKYSWKDIRIVRSSGLHLPRLKKLTIENLKSTNDIFCLFEVMCNLEEVNLLINQFDRPPLVNSDVPKSLHTMRLELTCKIEDQQTCDMLREFVFLFKTQFKSLKLVIFCTDDNKQFVVDLNDTLKANLPYLTYFICSMEIVDPPMPQPSATVTPDGGHLILNWQSLFPKMTLQRLKNQTTLLLDQDDRDSHISSLSIPDDTLLLKLREVCFFRTFDNPDMTFYSKLLSIAPNLTTLAITHSCSSGTIDLLRQLSRHTKLMIKKLRCSDRYKECIFEFHATFLEELSQILPKLQYLNLDTIMPKNIPTEQTLTPKLAIDHARTFLTKLIHLRIRLNVEYVFSRDKDVAGRAVQMMRKELDEYLQDDQYRNLYYEIMYENGQLCILDIWL